MRKTEDSLLVIRKYSQLKAENIRELMTDALQVTRALLGEGEIDALRS